MSFRCGCLSGVEVVECTSMFDGEATVLCIPSIKSLVRDDEAVDEAPSDPSVLSVLCILLSRSDRRREGVEKFSSFILLRGILIALLPGGYSRSVIVFSFSRGG